MTEEVRSYIKSRRCNFRLSTSCGGAILLPVSVKPPKPTDIQISVGDYTLYVSRYQARDLRTIHRGMIPRHYMYY
ncbi:MAG: hypothetical protein QMD46_04365 [Methanomicrobiales archaeon]|nr:hypothetical protein [Methanomicrobiales archaeon]MDI6876545.1 hypothetical protein [Methanomicrobiales archaeon]